MQNPEKITGRFVKSLLPIREKTAHKGDFGKVLLLCGSVGFTGAAALAAKAALRGGAGLVFLGVPEPVYPIVASMLLEAIVFPLPSEDGMLSAAAGAEIEKRLEDKDAVLIGPGLGRSEGVLSVVRTVLSRSRVPVVVDADGINVLSAHKNVLRESVCPTIVTPHEGEFARLGGDVKAYGREDAAKRLASELQTICVLKGSGTVVSDGTHVRVNTTGNPGMATGGSGDVLAGLLTALLGQGIEPFDAASAAVWLHGRAGDLCARRIGQYGMLPGDIVTTLPELLP